MTRRERKKRKIEKREEWAKSRDKASNEAYKNADEIAKAFENGQPILIGHHSEKRARRDQERIHNNMQKCVDNSNMADLHREKAEGLQRQLDNTIFSDDLDAIERLQEKINTLEKKRDRMKEIKKALTKGIDIELTETEKKHLEGNKRCWGDYNIMPYELTNIGATIRTAKKRIEKISAQKVMKNKRRIELSSIAEEQHLNHGKSWKCTDKNINDHDLPKEYEGQLICYVY
jgi:hypothetical protein